MIWLLAQPGHADLQRECREEVMQVIKKIQESPEHQSCGHEDATLALLKSGHHLDQLHLLKAIFAEIQRMNEMSMPTLAMCDFTVFGGKNGDEKKTVKKDSWILISGRVHDDKSQQFSPDVWGTAPDQFNIDPWLKTENNAQEHSFDEDLYEKFSFFGKGIHRCPGREFGRMMCLSIVAATLAYFEEISFPDANDGGDQSYVSSLSAIPKRRNLIITATPHARAASTAEGVVQLSVNTV